MCVPPLPPTAQPPAEDLRPQLRDDDVAPRGLQYVNPGGCAKHRGCDPQLVLLLHGWGAARDGGGCSAVCRVDAGRLLLLTREGLSSCLLCLVTGLPPQLPFCYADCILLVPVSTRLRSLCRPR